MLFRTAMRVDIRVVKNFFTILPNSSQVNLGYVGPKREMKIKRPVT